MNACFHDRFPSFKRSHFLRLLLARWRREAVMRKAEITQITSSRHSTHTQTTLFHPNTTYKTLPGQCTHSKSQIPFLHLPPPKLFLSARRRCACLELRCAGTSMHEAGDPQLSLHLDPQVNDTQATLQPFVFPRLHLHKREWGSKEYLWVLRERLAFIAATSSSCFLLQFNNLTPWLMKHKPSITLFFCVSLPTLTQQRVNQLGKPANTFLKSYKLSFVLHYDTSMLQMVESFCAGCAIQTQIQGTAVGRVNWFILLVWR